MVWRRRPLRSSSGGSKQRKLLRRITPGHEAPLPGSVATPSQAGNAGFAVPLTAQFHIPATIMDFSIPTNTPPLGAPNTTAGSTGFGSITSAGDPRVIQLALKLKF